MGNPLIIAECKTSASITNKTAKLQHSKFTMWKMDPIVILESFLPPKMNLITLESFSEVKMGPINDYDKNESDK